MKSIYVMDTPKACDECPLSLEIEKEVGTIICRGCEKYSVNSNSTEKPDWCPLKEVPEKDQSHLGWYPLSYVYGRAEGWNACIDEILKGSDSYDGK